MAKVIIKTNTGYKVFDEYEIEWGIQAQKAQQAGRLYRLFKSGNISNDEFICAICGKQPIEKHHENYNLWYSFIPLCRKCHHQVTVKQNLGKTRLERQQSLILAES